MRRFLFIIACFLLAPQEIYAGQLVHYGSHGTAYYARLNGHKAVDFVETSLDSGSNLDDGEFVITEAALTAISGGLPTGDYTGRVMTGHTAAEQDSTDTAVSIIPTFHWDNTTHKISYPTVNLVQVNGYDTLDGYTWMQIMSFIAANAAGNITNSSTATPHIRSLDDARDRMTATVDGHGNRTVTRTTTDIP